MTNEYVNLYDARRKGFVRARMLTEAGRLACVPCEGAPDSELFLSPGWIDAHAHVADGIGWLSVPPEDIGLRTGVFAIGDAGSTGATTFSAMRKYIMPVKRERLRAWIHINRYGLTVLPECECESCFSVQETADCLLANRDLVCGVKVRLLPDEQNKLGLLPLERAKQAAALAGMPVLVHMSSRSGITGSALDMLDAGDVVTHIMHPGPDALWGEDGSPLPALSRAMKRGVRLDIGNGRLSYDFSVCEAALMSTPELRFSIGSDIHVNSHPLTPDLATVMNRVLACGWPLEKVVGGVTDEAARTLGLTGWCDEDALMTHATVFRITPNHNRSVLRDANFNEKTPERLLRTEGIIIDGVYQALR